MRKLLHVAAIAASSGLLAAGALAVTGGIASASTSVTGCSSSDQVLALGIIPNCTSTGTVSDPTSLALTVSSQQLSSLLGITGQGIKDNWSVNCDEGGGATYTHSGTFTVTSAQTSTSTPLPTGGTIPNSCTITSEVQTVLGVSAGLLGLSALGVSDSVTAATAVPGAVWTGNGTSIAKCAGDFDNSSTVGAKVVIWTCLSDLSELWSPASNGELIHNGLCLSASGTTVSLQACTGAANQRWSQAAVGGEVALAGTSQCLTQPSPENGMRLTVAACAGKADQKWLIP